MFGGLTLDFLGVFMVFWNNLGVFSGMIRGPGKIPEPTEVLEYHPEIFQNVPSPAQTQHLLSACFVILE